MISTFNCIRCMKRIAIEGRTPTRITCERCGEVFIKSRVFKDEQTES